MSRTIQLHADATEADIIRALADLPDGGTIIFPEAKTISIRSGLNIDVTERNITLDLNGSTLRKAGDVSVIIGVGEHDDAASVRLSANGAGNAVVTYSTPPADLAAGDWVKIVSDDKLPGDHLEGSLPSRMGQAMEVLSVAGNTVTFKGALIDQPRYDTNVRASSYVSGELVVTNGDIVGDLRQSSWDMPLLQLRSLVDARVENVTVRDGFGRGINVVDCVDAEITNVAARNLIDGGSATLGIAVSSLSSIGTAITGLYAENVTHATDNNAIGTVPNSDLVGRYGGDIGMNVADSVAVATRNFAWSWHSEAVDGIFDNVMAFDCEGFLMARGIGGQMRDSGGSGNERGIILYEYGDNDARDITIDGVTLRDTLKYSVFAAENPRNNAISNSYFESYGPGRLATALQVAISGTVFADADDNPNDLLNGTGGGDMLLGGDGSDDIRAGAADDYLWGGAGADRLTGGYGRDRFVYLSRAEAGDTITDFAGGNGGDVLDLSVLAAKYGWDRGDAIADGHLRFLQTGDHLRVQVDSNGGSNDFATLVTLENIHSWEIGAGNLRLSLAPAGAPPPAGAPGPAPGPDTTMRGTDGDDTLRGDYNTDRIIGGGGADRLIASSRDTLLEGGAGKDFLTGNQGADMLKGGSGQDRIWGGAGADRLWGETGNDVLRGGEGADMLVGGAGYDTADHADASGRVFADIASPAANAGDAAGDRYSSIENLTGGDFNDILNGNQAGNVLDGGAGNDALSGRSGADTLRGGDGNDWLDGGAWKDVLAGGDGADRFFFANTAQAGDTIADFESGVDHLLLSADGFDGFDFVDGTEANSARATLLNDQNGGKLLWDADGTGAQDAVLLARISGHAPVSEADIWVV